MRMTPSRLISAVAAYSKITAAAGASARSFIHHINVRQADSEVKFLTRIPTTNMTIACTADRDHLTSSVVLATPLALKQP